MISTAKTSNTNFLFKVTDVEVKDEGGLTAPMPGKILEVHVREGQSVSSGDVLMVMEAMKMEHKIVASSDGKVDSINFKEGDQVPQGAELLSISE